MDFLNELTASIDATAELAARKVMAETLTNVANGILAYVQKNLGEKKRGRKKPVEKAEAPVEQKPKRKYTRHKPVEVDDTVSEDPVKMAGKKRGPKSKQSVTAKSVYDLQQAEEEQNA